MKSRRVAILLLPSRIEIAAISGGRVTAAERIAASLPGEAETWSDAVRGSAEWVRPVVERLGLAGQAAVVLYSSPSQAVEVISLQAKTTSQAVAAARLSGIESLAFPASDAACAVMVLGRDTGGEGRQTHVLTCVDRDDHLEAVVDLVERSGLTFTCAAPMDGAVAAGLIHAALHEPNRDGASLFIGELSSVFMARREGRLRFVRRIGLGTEHLITSLTRPIRGSDDRTPVELSREAAANTLHRCGIPDEHRTAPWPDGLSPRQLMPLLQPVLQRLVVELRQSLRFSLSESERQGISVELTGPGGGIAGLDDLLHAQLGFEVKVDPACREHAWQTPAAGGSELRLAVEHEAIVQQIGLTPRATASKQMHGRIRRWLLAGAAAAVVVVGFDGLRVRTLIDQARAHSESLALQTSESAALQTTFTRMTESLGALNALERQITEETSGQPNVRALLQELSRLVPPALRLRSISLQRQSGATTGSIQGHRIDHAGDVAAMSLDQFVVLLESSPLISGVTLGNVQVIDVDGAPAQEFQVSFTAVAAPREAEEIAIRASAHAISGEGAP